MRVVGLAARLQCVQDVMGIGGEAEAGVDARCLGDVRSGERAGVCHAQVEQIDPAGATEDATDPALDAGEVLPEPVGSLCRSLVIADHDRCERVRRLTWMVACPRARRRSCHGRS